MIVPAVDVDPTKSPVGPVSVSVLTTLIDWIDVSQFGTILASLENQSATATVTLIVEYSAFGTYPDSDTRTTVDAPPQKEACIEAGPNQSHKFVRVSAQSTGTANVRASLRGVHRVR
jgi:hypothetical protein